MNILIGNKVIRTLVMAVFLVGITVSVALAQQQSQVYQRGNVTVYKQASQDTEGAGTIDFKNAKPMPLPKALSVPQPLQGSAAAMPARVPGFRPGFRGDDTVLRDIAAPNETQAPGPPVLQEYGTSEHPFTTSRVDLGTKNTESKQYPYRASGKLFFNIGPDTYVCSATLIEPGIIVTAAHCVAEFGGYTFYSNWQFMPAYYNGKHPYKVVYTMDAIILTSYYEGTDPCFQSGVVCANDVAVLVAAPSGKYSPTNTKYPGWKTGWLGFGWDGYGFSTPSSGPGAGYTIALINQLGYPQSHDYGEMMQRTDSQGYVSGTMSSNTVWGSRQTGGSSGGPEIVNLGAEPFLNGTSWGFDSDFNIIVGVTSWGYTDASVKQQGASAFTSGNVLLLHDVACGNYPLACY